MISLLYEVGLLLLCLIALPKMLYMQLFYKKYRHSFIRKFGYGFPSINKGERYLIWIHAVSVGETKAVATLAKLLKAELENPYLLISSSTETGHVEAQRSIPFADAHVYLPFDFGWIIKPIVRRVAPDLVILCESDFWYNFLTEAKKQGAKAVLINGKISERSCQRFCKVPAFAQALFAPFDALCLQSHHYEERFKRLGLPLDKMKVTGNVKFDDAYPRLPPKELEAWKQQLGLQPNQQVLVVGSSHDPEEKLLIDVLEGLWERFPNLRVLLVPRHPERFNEVANLLKQRSVNYQRFSALNGHPSAAAKVTLIDSMGLLRRCYQLADIALVGGSFTAKVGGHNIVEPSWYGVPVLFGPHMHSQPELLELVSDYGSGKQVSPDLLQSTLEELLSDAEQRKKLGEAGLKLIDEMQGATHKTWQVLKALM